jgi:hypothetical protein
MFYQEPVTRNAREQLRAELEAQHAELAALAHRLEDEVRRGLQSGANGWHGPAHSAFSTASGILRNEAQSAVDAVSHARRMTHAALIEVERGV